MFKRLCLVGASLLIAVIAFGGGAWLSTDDGIPLGGQIMFDAVIALVAGFIIFNVIDEEWNS